MNKANPSLYLKRLLAQIVVGHEQGNSVSTTELTKVTSTVYEALAGLERAEQEPARQQQPAVAIKRSVFPDYIVCLEDGAKLKSMKRSLANRYKLTPGEYRKKWGLPSTYPMVAPNYSIQRGRMARERGLGAKKALEADLDAAVEVAPDDAIPYQTDGVEAAGMHQPEEIDGVPIQRIPAKKRGRKPKAEGTGGLFSEE